MSSNHGVESAGARFCRFENWCLAETASKILAGATFGYLGTAVFTTLNPVSGAIFGATFFVVDAVAQTVFAQCFNEGKRTIISSLSAFIVSALATGALINAAFGVSLTGETALVLAASAIAAEFLVTAVLVCCCGIVIFGAVSNTSAAQKPVIASN